MRARARRRADIPAPVAPCNVRRVVSWYLASGIWFLALLSHAGLKGRDWAPGQAREGSMFAVLTTRYPVNAIYECNACTAYEHGWLGE